MIGGILSFSILAIASAYFYYLMDMYFQNKIEPTINSNSKLESSLMQISVKEDFFLFQMMIGGIPLPKYEKKVRKKYLNFSIAYSQYFKNGTYSINHIPIIECSDSNFLGYFCMDDNDISNKFLIRNSKEVVVSTFTLSVKFYDSSVELNCADKNEIISTILKSSNHLSVYTQIKQFNSASKGYEIVYKEEYYHFDPDLFLYSSINLTKATTNVTEGLIIQQSESTNTIYDYLRKDTVFSNTNVKQRLDTAGFGVTVFQLSQISKNIVFQYPMITQIFAQFMSIFNFLLTLGILARMHAETQIVEEMNSILLKKYYKTIAARLLNKEEDKIRDQKLEDSNREQSLINLIPIKISKLLQQINKANFFRKNKQAFNKYLIHKIKQCYQFLFRRGNEKSNNQNNSEIKIYNQLLKKSLQRINIFEIYNDLIQLKMAIKLILTKEQFAAMQFCGSELPLEDNSNMNDLIENNFPLKYQNEGEYDKNQEELEKNQSISEVIPSSSFHSNMKILKENTIFKSLRQIQSNQIKDQFRLQIKSETLSPHQNNQEIQESLNMKFSSSNKILEQSDFNNLDNFIQNTNKIELLILKEDKEIAIHESQTIEPFTPSPKPTRKKISIDQGQKQLSTYSHLQVMDLIEENYEIQEKPLQNFFKNILNNQSQNASHIDRQILQSLLIQQKDESRN